MKKIEDKLKQYMKVNKKLFIFLIVILIVGIISGTIFSLSLNKSDNLLVTEYLNEYITTVTKNANDYGSSLINSISSNLFVSILIWILGFSVIGIPITLILFFYKSFIIGFSLGSILINYKFKGILMSIAYFFPHYIINMLIMIYLIVSAFKISGKIIEAVFKRREIDFKPITHNYLTTLIIILVLNLIISLYEVFVSPIFIKLIALRLV